MGTLTSHQNCYILKGRNNDKESNEYQTATSKAFYIYVILRSSTGIGGKSGLKSIYHFVQALAATQNSANLHPSEKPQGTMHGLQN